MYLQKIYIYIDITHIYYRGLYNLIFFTFLII